MVKVSRFFFMKVLILGVFCNIPAKIQAMHCIEKLVISGRSSITRDVRFHTPQRYNYSHISRRFFSSSFDRPNNLEKPIYILSIDGGGIRSLIPAKILARVEDNLEKTYGYPIRLASLFDVIAGASTGGIMALGLSAPAKTSPELDHSEKIDASQGYPAKTLVKFYKDHGSVIFPGGGEAWGKSIFQALEGKYNNEPLKVSLQSYFQDLRLKEALTRLIIPAHAINENFSNGTYIFDSNDANVPTKDYAMKYVARAASAAPTLFTAATIQNQNQDSRMFTGVWDNNPTKISFEKSLTLKSRGFFIVSLGTGEIPPMTYSIMDINKAIDQRVLLEKRDAVHQRLLLEQKNAKDNGLEISYIRIQPVIRSSDAYTIDNVTPENISTLEEYADLVIDGKDGENSEKFYLLISQLERRLAERGIFPKVE